MIKEEVIMLFKKVLAFLPVILIMGCFMVRGEEIKRFISEDTQKMVIEKLIVSHGESQRERIEKGVKMAASLWREEDGGSKDFENFCLQNFVSESVSLESTFKRIERNFETISGFFHQVQRTLLEPLDLDWGKPLPVDYLFANYTPYAHLLEDMFKTKIAFFVILNFPNYSLEEKLNYGSSWSREKWAQVLLGDSFTSRVPAEVNQKMNEIFVSANNYISEYNIFMGNLLDNQNRTLFPKDLKLISHWGLRDELKAQYANPDGLPKQEIIFKVMERIIEQSIPKIVINSDAYYWNPFTNKVFEKKNGNFVTIDFEPENEIRYKHFLSIFHAQKLLDPYVPDAPTLIERRFNKDRKIPEKEVEQLLTSILSSPLTAKVGRLVEKRLGRKLRPFDIWYNGFKPRGFFKEEELDKIVKEKYPNLESFQSDLPNILKKLGFSEEKAKFLSERIVVDPARGSGHAMGSQMRADKAHLRTRVTKDGINYKGFNIAIHELGHNVEQVFSLHGIDYYFLSGVPNTAFTECFAFLFQNRDLEILGLKKEDPMEKYLHALDTFWMTYEIGGVALVDMKVWRWMYENPDATPSQLKEAVISTAKEVWNKYYAPVFKVKDSPILAIYSHMIDSAMYLPDYPLGHIISFQLEKYMEGKNLGEEMERMCRLGSLTPKLWMEKAIGSEISTKPLLKATEEALKYVKK